MYAGSVCSWDMWSLSELRQLLLISANFSRSVSGQHKKASSAYVVVDPSVGEAERPAPVETAEYKNNLKTCGEPGQVGRTTLNLVDFAGIGT